MNNNVNQSEDKREAFIKLLKYSGLSENEAASAYASLNSDTKKMTKALDYLNFFTKLDKDAYLKAIDYLANDEKEKLAQLMLNQRAN